MFASALLPSRIYHMVMAHPSSHSAWSQRSPQPRAVSSLHKHCLDRTYGTLLFVTYSWPCLETRRRQWHRTPVLLPGKSHGRRRLVGCSPWSREESDTTERLHFHFSLSCIGEGNGTALQYSGLENPMDGGAWRAAVHGVAQSRTLLKWLSSSSSLETSNLFLFLVLRCLIQSNTTLYSDSI